MYTVNGKLKGTGGVIVHLLFIIMATFIAPMMVIVYSIEDIPAVVIAIMLAVFSWLGVETHVDGCKNAERYHTLSQQNDRMFKKAEARLRIYLISKGLRPSYTDVHFAVLHGVPKAEVERDLRRIYSH